MKPHTITFALAVLAVRALAQQRLEQPDTQQPQTQRRLRSGLRLDYVSFYSQGDYVRTPLTLTAFPAPLWLLTGGGTGGVSAHFGRHARFSAAYTGGYSYNHRYPSLNGANHSVSIEFRSDPARRTIFSAGANGESGLISDALFDPSYTLALTRRAGSLDKLAQELIPGATVGVLDSAVEVTLSGGRRRSGGAHMALSRSHSRRLSTQASVSVLREIHTYSRDQVAGAGYANVTIGIANVGATYVLSAKTQLIGDVGYSRSDSRQYRSEWETAGLGIRREVGRHSFAVIQGGYVRVTDQQTSGSGTSSYTFTGGYGTTTGRHTMALTARRAGGDVHGIGSQSTVGADFAWSWFSPASAWAVGVSSGYERVGSAAFGRLQAWLSQLNVTRRISGRVELAITGMYVGHISEAMEMIDRAGFRIALVWRPGSEVRH